MSNYPFRTISAATALCLISTTSSATVFQIGGDLSTLSTTDQNMFDDEIGVIAFQPQDLTIVDTGILETKVVGSINTVVDPAKVVDYGVKLGLYEAAVFAQNVAVGECNDLPAIVRPPCVDLAILTTPIPDKPTFPSPSLKDGTQLTISNVGVKFGLGGEFNLGEGKVSASQEFQSNFTVDKDSFEAGDVLTIGTSADFGTASLSSELGGLDGKVEQVLSVSGKMHLESYVLGTELANETLFNEDINDERTTIVGFELDDQSVELTGLGQTLPINIENGVPYTFTKSPPESPIGFPVADVAFFAPDMDVENAVGLSSLGAPFDVSTKVETTRIADGQRTGSGFAGPFDAASGVLPEDFMKLDLDVDAVTIAGGLPLGVKAGTLVGNIEMNLLDLDAGAFFSLGQEQSFETKEIYVTLNFSIPTEVETQPGSGIYASTTTKKVVLGTEVKIKHPGGDLQITPQYSMGDNSYFNRTLMTLSPAVTLALGQVKIGGAFGAVLPNELKGFTLFEEVFEPLDTFELGDLFSETFGLANFDTKLGSAFSLSANPEIAISTVPIPTTLPLLAGSLGLLGALRRRRKH